MSRKNIGVFISGEDEQLHCVFLQGIKEKAFFYDYNVISFHSLLNKAIYGSEAKMSHILSQIVIDGEYSIFWGHDLSVLDGIIIAGETFISPDTKGRLLDCAKEKNIPVVDINDMDERCCSVLFDDTKGMEMIVSHVVKEHGCKKIYFVSGYKGNLESEQRLNAYFKVLKENNIEINEEYICYGKFCTEIAADSIERLVKEYGIPDAIVCANDSMALGCISKLSELGYSVPDDCIVTGFDGIKEAQNYYPALSSVKRAIKQLGMTAVDALHRMINGEEVPSKIYVPAELILNQSCGCMEKNDRSISKFFSIINGQTNDLRLFENNLINMTRQFTGCNSIDDIISVAMQYAEAFRIPDISFYINENIVYVEDEMNDKADGIYTPMLTRYSRNYITKETSIERVPSATVLSDILMEATDNTYLGISPLYFRKKIIGFILLNHLYCVSYLPMFYTWSINLCSTIGNYCLRKEMRMLIDTLDDMYIKDSLTGLNNRFGLHRYAEKLISQAVREKRSVFGVEIDLDRLKIINDTYGHKDGDNAIVQVANAMRFAADEKMVLSRIGGDEYFILGLCDGMDEARGFINKVDSFLKSYNRGSGLSYDIDCSCGYFISDKGIHDLEEIMKYSDIEMYKVKKAKKARRT